MKITGIETFVVSNGFTPPRADPTVSAAVWSGSCRISASA